MYDYRLTTKNNYVIINKFPIYLFKKDAKTIWGKNKVLNFIIDDASFITQYWSKRTVKIPQFFIPELVYMLKTILSIKKERKEYAKLIEALETQTWFKSTIEQHISRVNKKLLQDLNVSLRDIQLEFLDIYDIKRQAYQLDGYLLAFEQGLGKTITSLSLMHTLSKKVVIIIAPKSTIVPTWVNEINTIFKEKQEIWHIGMPFKKARFYIVNYESIDKVINFSSVLPKKEDIGIIIDEWHNFRNKNATRVQSLLQLARSLECTDIIPMSGTPIKAMGSELIPLVMLLDSKYFNDEAIELFTKAFGLNSNIAFDILKNRLGIMMFRKLKSEVLSLPEKITEDVYIEFSGANKFTLTNVKKLVMEFTKERLDYYQKNKKHYEQVYQEGLTWFELNCIKSNEQMTEYKKYLFIVNKIIINNFISDEERIEAYVFANAYEKIIYTQLPSSIKHEWKKAKSVVKYVRFCVMGEVLGGLLTKLRTEMFTQMLFNSPIFDIIENAEKKTICFTSYVDVAECCYKFLTESYNLKPLVAYSKTSKDIPNILKIFSDPSGKENPLIATIQTLSTGVTAIIANTVIFLNKPWRSVDYLQAQDRIHRIGQDTTCYIYNFILKTGNEPNLSTRMEDIVAWSQSMFENIVGTTNVEKIIANECLNNALLFTDILDYTTYKLEKVLF